MERKFRDCFVSVALIGSTANLGVSDKLSLTLMLEISFNNPASES